MAGAALWLWPVLAAAAAAAGDGRAAAGAIAYWNVVTAATMVAWASRTASSSRSSSSTVAPWWGPVDENAGLRPAKPYRAWCWSAHDILADHPNLYVGTNLDFTPTNQTVAQIENNQGIASLASTTGPQSLWGPPHFIGPNNTDGGVNNTGATAYYMHTMGPGPCSLVGCRPGAGAPGYNASFYYGGRIINEWNRDVSATTYLVPCACPANSEKHDGACLNCAAVPAASF